MLGMMPPERELEGLKLQQEMLQQAVDVMDAARASMAKHGADGTIETLCFTQMKSVCDAAAHDTDVEMLRALATHLNRMADMSAAALRVAKALAPEKASKTRNMGLLAEAMFTTPITAQLFCGMSGGRYELRIVEKGGGSE